MVPRTVNSSLFRFIHKKGILHGNQFPLEEAPSGMLARGSYKVKSRFIDDDGQCHLEWEWVQDLLIKNMEIKKDWE
jgi:Rho GDP-dissociation inhibitor